MKQKLYYFLMIFMYQFILFAQPGECLDFDGNNDFVNCGTSLNSVIDPLNTITVEAWVRPTTNAGLGVIVGNYANNDQSSMQFLLRRDSNNYSFWISGIPGNFKDVIATNAVTINTWQHVAGVWNGSELRIYVDGILRATRTGVTESSFAATTNALHIGNNQAGTGAERFTGSIDEVRIWNFAKTIEQINGAKNCELPSSSPGLIAYYTFNQGNSAQNNSTVTTLNAVAGPNGTLTNFALNGSTSNWLAGSPVTTGSVVPSVATVTTPVVYLQGDIATPLTATIGANGTGLLWYTAATGGVGSTTAPTPSTATLGNTTYWVTSTNANGCESARTALVVSVKVSNDDCSNTISLTVGASFNDAPANVVLSTATNSGTPTPVCGNYQGGDVWYTSTVPASGNLVIETNGTGVYDTGLEIYTGTCGALNLFSCDDNNGNGDYSKIVLLGQTPGTVFRIRVWENFFANSNAQFQVAAYDYIEPATHLNFDGTDDVVNLGTGLTSYFTGRTQVTLQAWVRPETATGLGTIIGNYNYPNNINAMQMMLRRDGLQYTFWLDTGSGYTSIAAVNAVVLNTWQHVTGTWDGSTMRLYINGNLVNSAAKTGTIPAKTTSFSIGSNVAERFDGDIDEIRIWNVALAPTDIMNTMNCEAINQQELVAHYKFNQGNDYSNNTSVLTLADSSGNNYSGTLTNFSLTGATSNWRRGSIVITGNSCALLSSSNFESTTSIKVYPNPSNGMFTIETKDNLTVELYDMVGKLVTSKKVNVGNSTIDITNFDAGIYILKATTATGANQTYKVIKE